MALTDAIVRNAKPQATPYRLSDVRGLFLWVTPGGTKSWRTVYQIEGKPRLHTLGQYPAMTLAQARAARELLRNNVRQGADPNAQRAAGRQEQLDHNAQTVEVMARKWHAKRAENKWLESYARRVEQQLVKYVFQVIGNRPVRSVKRADIKQLLDRITQGKVARDRVRSMLLMIFEYWLCEEVIDRNPVKGLTEEYPTPPHKHQPRAADIDAARAVLAAMETSGSGAPAKLLHRFLALTAVRPNEARGARWSEFTRPGWWDIPAERMKGRRDRKRGLAVPLSAAAQQVIDAARELATSQEFVFARDGAQLSSNTLPEALRCVTPRGGVKHVPHGWRGTFSTVMNEAHHADFRIIDAMLGHKPRGGMAASGAESPYNGARHDLRKRELANEWARELLRDAPDAWQLAGIDRPDVPQQLAA